MNLSMNFHIGFSNKAATTAEGRFLDEYLLSPKGTRENPPPGEDAVRIIRQGIPLLMGNSATIIALLTSDICERFPTLKFVSVESGFGYVPYLLEAADWLWYVNGARDAYRERLLPSEYFKRQCYGTFWFEQRTLSVLEEYPDNFMFETDFPHPTSMAPGPGSYAENPLTKIERDIVARLSPTTARKVLYENAATVYNHTLSS
jgi:predicted TIM-barrel fold metal-dependent hydrolase